MDAFEGFTLGVRWPRGAHYLDDLNPAQREAVEALDSPVLMLAGAGREKLTLTSRIVHLQTQGVRPTKFCR